MELPEILALAREHMLNVNERVSGFTTSAPILTLSVTREQLQSFIAAVERQAYERGLEDAAKHCDKRYAFELAREIRAMKGST